MNNDTEIITAESGTVALLNRSEIDMQVTTAHKYPRSISKFCKEALAMVTLNEQVAQECIYSLPRDGKNIEGASARFAEVVASAWGNSRAGARIVSDSGDFVTAQGVFHDLERNVAITYEVQRRIVDKNGKRFRPDMIGVTANAACSIALRNAILKGVPKAFWSDMYDQAREVAIGNVQTLSNRRTRALSVLQKMGVQKEQVFTFLGIESEVDMTLEHLATLFGMTTAIKEGDTTPESAFNIGSAAAAKKEAAFYQQDQFDASLPKWKKAIADGKPVDDLIAMIESKAPLTEAQKTSLKSNDASQATTVEASQPAPLVAADADGVMHTFDQIKGMLENAATLDALADAATLINSIKDKKQKATLTAIYEERGAQLN